MLLKSSKNSSFQFLKRLYGGQVSHIEDGCIRFEMADLMERIINPFSCFTTYYERFYPFRDASGVINIRFSGIMMSESIHVSNPNWRSLPLSRRE